MRHHSVKLSPYIASVYLFHYPPYFCTLTVTVKSPTVLPTINVSVAGLYLLHNSNPNSRDAHQEHVVCIILLYVYWKVQYTVLGQSFVYRALNTITTAPTTTTYHHNTYNHHHHNNYYYHHHHHNTYYSYHLSPQHLQPPSPLLTHFHPTCPLPLLPTTTIQRLATITAATLTFHFKRDMIKKGVYV